MPFEEFPEARKRAEVSPTSLADVRQAVTDALEHAEKGLKMAVQTHEASLERVHRAERELKVLRRAMSAFDGDDAEVPASRAWSDE